MIDATQGRSLPSDYEVPLCCVCHQKGESESLCPYPVKKAGVLEDNRSEDKRLMEWDDAYLDDFVTLSVYADYLEDRGDSVLVEGIRYCVAHKIRPYRSEHYEDQYCWTNDRYRVRMGYTTAYDHIKIDWLAAAIPNEVFDKIPHNLVDYLMINEVRMFQTAEEAYRELGRALLEGNQ